MQTDATLLANNSQHCWMLHVPSVKPVKLFSQQLPTFLLFLDRRSVAQQCWIRLHSSSNIVGATQAHYAWFKKTYGLYPSRDALQVPTLLGAVASVCTPLPTRTQQLPTLLRQKCWELLRPFAHSLRENYNNWLVPAYIASHGIVDYCLISALRKCYNHLCKKRRVTAMWLFEP